MLAVLPRGEEHGRERRHPRAERDRGLGPFERRERLLEPPDGRVVEPGVDRVRRLAVAGDEGVEAVGGRVEIGERVRRREVERGGVDAERGEVGAAGVDGAGSEGFGAEFHRRASVVWAGWGSIVL